MKRILVFAFTILLASGCGSSNVASYGKVDSLEKTGTIPAGHYGVLDVMKKTLTEEGWTLIVSEGDEKIVGTVGSEVDLTKTHERKPRYRFLVHQHAYDVCIPNGYLAVNYEIVVVDNKTGAELTSILGNGCLGILNAKIAAALRGL